MPHLSDKYIIYVSGESFSLWITKLTGKTKSHGCPFGYVLNSIEVSIVPNALNVIVPN